MKPTSLNLLGFAAFFYCVAAANSASLNSRATPTTNNITQQLALNAASVPECASACATDLPSGCLGDPQCICGHDDFMNNITCCVAANCSASDILLTQQFAGQLCRFVGQELPTNPSCPTSTQTTTSATTLAKSWNYQGCYSEATNYNRALNSTYYIDQTAMTPDACVTFCKSKGLKYAGTEYGQECWCGNAIQLVNGATKLKDESRCNMPCKGNTKLICGGPATLNIYKSA